MANLLERYGLKPESKKFSISFIDDFVDCSYRTFLTRFMGIYQEDVDLPRAFGTGCHRGLRRINKAMKEGRMYCSKCEFDCKLNSAEKVKAMSRTVEECLVKQILMEEYAAELDEDFEIKLIEKHRQKGTSVAEVKESIAAHRRYAMNCMFSALFQKQPVGDVLLTEEVVSGTLDGAGVLGVIDLVLGIKGKSLILDYKSTSAIPSGSLPIRQLALYIHILEQLGFPVNGVGALYMLKKDPPKTIRKNSKPFKQTELMFMNVDKHRNVYENTLSLISEDITAIKDAISTGTFIRNKRSMYCPCSAVEYCDNTCKLDAAVSKGIYGPGAKSRPDIEV